MNFRFRYSILPYDIGKLMNSCRFVEAFAYFGIKIHPRDSWFPKKYWSIRTGSTASQRTPGRPYGIRDDAITLFMTSQWSKYILRHSRGRLEAIFRDQKNDITWYRGRQIGYCLFGVERPWTYILESGMPYYFSFVVWDDSGWFLHDPPCSLVFPGIKKQKKKSLIKMKNIDIIYSEKKKGSSFKKKR